MFATLFANMGGRAPTDDFWYQPVGGLRTAAGQRVTAQSAMQLAAVFGCVRVLSFAMGVLPFKLYRPKVGGGRTLIARNAHWLPRLMSRRPNQYQNWFEWRTMMQAHLSLRGNGYNLMGALGGDIVSLTPIHPDRIKPEPLDNGSWRYRWTKPTGEQVYLSRQEVWHLRTLSDDGISGLAPVEAVREVIGGALGAQDYSNRFIGNDQKPVGGWLEFPGTIANDAMRDKIKEQAQRAGGRQGKMLVLDRGMKYHEVGLTNKDSQFLELRKFQQTEICGIFGVPPHMIANLDRATFANIEQQGIDFWTNTMLPWVTLWEAACGDLLGDDGPDSELEPVFDFEPMMRGDMTARAAYLHNLVLDGIITRNEGRDKLGYDPIKGLDEPLVPVNEMTLEQSQNPEPVTPPGVDTPAKEAQPEPDEDDAPPPKKKSASAESGRLAALIDGNAARMARRIAAGDVPGAETLAEALAVSQERAAKWRAVYVEVGTISTADEIAASLRTLGGAS